MARDLELRFGKQPIRVPVEQRTVVLVDDDSFSARLLDAVIGVDCAVIRGADGGRGTVAEQLPKKMDSESVQRLLAQLQLEDSVLNWRLRDTNALPRMVASAFVALASDVKLLVYDLTAVSGAPFETAHLCAHMRRAAEMPGVHVVAVTCDPALIASAGAHVVVFDGDAVAEAGPVEAVLSAPSSDALRRRLDATPIPNPLAMQLRRVQRLARRPINYAHTTIIALPTRDSIALAGGEEAAESLAD